jgi:predicted ATPase/DNA-binding winged helix-turn-helix (wHTH) protein
MGFSDLPDRKSEAYRFGPFRLIPAERLLLNGDQPVVLGGRAFDLLLSLVARTGEVVTHKDVAEQVWPNTVVEESSLRVQVAALRRALGDGRDGARYIASIRGRGYSFVAPVEHSRTPSLAAGTRVPAKTLPARLPRMIGRDETIDALRAEVAARRFLTIVGPGGVGKTTVAVAVAHRMAADFEGAICFIDLSVQQDGAFVVSAVASAVGYVAETVDSLHSLLAFLSDRRMLLVLDNCEHVVDAVANLTERLYQAAPQLHIIATSREALRAEGEHVRLLYSLDSPADAPMLTAAEAMAFPAVQLFMDRAAAGGYCHDLGDAEAPMVADICRRLDGLPLAIELAASRAGTYGLERLAALVGERLMLLWQGRRSVPRHQTLAAMHDWSFQLLSEAEQSILCRLSVFVGAFTLDMAQAVASGPDHTGTEVLDAIGSLVDKSLISVAGGQGADAYRLLDTTHTYAAAQLKARNATDATARRHAAHFADRLAALRIDRLEDTALSAHARHLGDIRAALEWSFSDAGDASIGVRLGAGAVPLLVGLSLLGEARRWCLRCLQALRERERGTAVEVGLQLALAIAAHHAHSDSAEVGTALARGLALAESLGDSGYHLELLAGQNLYGTRSADTDAQVAAAERYAAIATRLGGSREIVAASWMLGASHHLAGDQASARRHYAEGFARAASADISEVHSFGYNHRVRALIGYARTLWLAGLPDQAARFAYEGIAFAGRKAEPVSLSIGLAYAAPVFLWRGELEVAEDLIERLIAHAAKYSLASYQAAGQGLRGELLLAQGRTPEGIAALRAALPLLQAQSRYIFSSAFSRALAEGLARSGDTDQAESIIDKVLADAASVSGTYEQPDLMRTRAAILLAANPNDFPAAEAALQEALDLARHQSSLGYALRAALLLARWWIERGRAAEARILLEEVKAQFTEGFDTADLRKAADLLRNLQAPPRARKPAPNR